MPNWEEIATADIENTHPILPLIGSLGLGLVGVVMVNPVFGMCALGAAGLFTCQRALAAAKQDEAIREYGCYSITLKAENLREYVKEFGTEHTAAELLWAEEEGYQLSHAAQDWLEAKGKHLPVVKFARPSIETAPLVPAPVPVTVPVSVANVSQDSAHSLAQPFLREIDTLNSIYYQAAESAVATTTIVTSNSSQPSKDVNFLQTLLPKIQNYCFIGLPRSGKDYLCSLLAEEAKRLFGVKIFVIDPKGDPNESVLWEGIADRVYRFVGFETSSQEHAKHIRSAFQGFRTAVKESQGEHRWILIYNEFTTSALELKAANDPFLAGELPKLIAMGDSLKMNLWLMAQSPHMNAGLDGSVLGMFARLLIIQPENLGTMQGWQKTQLMTGVNLDRVDEICRQSEMSRAVFCSAIEQRWLSMPRLARKTRWYCRETEQWIGDVPESISTAPQHLGDETSVQIPQTPTSASHLGTSAPQHLGDETSVQIPQTCAMTPPQHFGDIQMTEPPASALQYDFDKTLVQIPESVATKSPQYLGEKQLAIDTAVLNYFANASKKEPKRVTDIKAASSMRLYDDNSLAQSLERLIRSEKLESPMRGYWSLPEWID